MKKPTVGTILDDLGGASHVAGLLRSPRRKGKPLTRAAVSKWKRTGRVPPEYCRELCAMPTKSGRQYQPEHLRRDIFGEAANQ